MISEDLKVGKPFEIGNRIFYPIVKIFSLKHSQGEIYSLSPVALVVVENDLKYLIPFEEVENPHELIEMISS